MAASGTSDWLWPVLTAINLLIYAADLVYWARQLSVGTEHHPSTLLPLHSQGGLYRALCPLMPSSWLPLSLLAPFPFISLSLLFPSLHLLCLLPILLG